MRNHVLAVILLVTVTPKAPLAQTPPETEQNQTLSGVFMSS
jgi:hypothetical protein